MQNKFKILKEKIADTGRNMSELQNVILKNEALVRVQKERLNIEVGYLKRLREELEELQNGSNIQLPTESQD